ncbi:hypothetical protein NA63_1816 [Flavobacteriaceae bacterium MAR_2010_105]|nr:hypothetical protein NA63_1816 [Flavobacteriaceae bacterium MAR_2010_105]
MKKTFLFLLLVTVLTSFTKTQNENTITHYAFVTDTEHDKAYDEDSKNGYVNIATNIVSINCELSKNTIENQYIKHYEAEERTSNRDRAFIGSPGITSVWIYNSYDEAVASRRDWLAKKGSEQKRTIKYFYVTCN